MSFTSVQFLLFFPIVAFVYFIIPKKISHLWLLAASYYFYMQWNAKYALLMLLSTFVTYICGILIQKSRDNNEGKYSKLILIICLLINLGILFFYKYYDFSTNIFTAVFERIGLNIAFPKFDLLLPVGISFYTFQALGYSIDVYRGTIRAEKDFFRYALFVSFFPQLVAGPIERSKNLLCQLFDRKPYDYEDAMRGFLMILWGYFLKLMIADRCAIFVNKVYESCYNYGAYGSMFFMATVFFAMQIYCDFYGYSMIAKGSARMLGIQIMDNFSSPYLSCSVSEFWRNWHISLTSWFKDYLYIPLGGSRKGKFRKYLNKLIVFVVSGLWHGAAVKFVIWGFLNGLFQVIEEVFGLTPKKDSGFIRKAISGVITFVLVVFAWVFFRADRASLAVYIIDQIFTRFNLSAISIESFGTYGLSSNALIVLAISMIILLVSDVCKKKNISLLSAVAQLPWYLRGVYTALSILVIAILGVYGPTYVSAAFIYFQF